MVWNQGSIRGILWIGCVGFFALILIVPKFFMNQEDFIFLLKGIGGFVVIFALFILVWYFTTYRPLLKSGIFPQVQLDRLRSGATISLSQLIPTPEGLGWGSHTTLTAEAKDQGCKESTRYMIVRGHDAGNVRVAIVVIELPVSLDGQFVITFDPTMGDAIARQNSLESNLFNKMFQISAVPPNLAQRVMSPDFMDWLMQEGHPEIISLKDNVLSIWYSPRGVGISEQQSLGTAWNILDFIKGSGALEKKA